MSPAAMTHAKERRQASLELLHPGSLVIEGTTYSGGGLYLSGFKAEMNESGNWSPAQRFKLHVRKSRLATPPEKKTKFTSAGFTWKVDEVAGQSPTEIAWIIKGIRWPDSPS